MPTPSKKGLQPLTASQVAHIGSATAQWIADGFHVGASNMAIVRECYRRMRRNNQTRAVWSRRAARHAFYRLALARHHHNRNLYRYVMGGIS